MLTPVSPCILFLLKEVKCCLSFEDDLTPKCGLDTCKVSPTGKPFIKSLRYCEQKQPASDSVTKRIQEICKISLRNESISMYVQNFEEKQGVKPMVSQRRIDSTFLECKCKTFSIEPMVRPIKVDSTFIECKHKNKRIASIGVSSCILCINKVIQEMYMLNKQYYKKPYCYVSQKNII